VENGVFPFLGTLFLFAGACLGHLALLVGSHNWFYGQPVHRRVADLVHLVHGGLFLAGVFAAWKAVGLDLTALFHSGDWGRKAAAGYVILCWTVGFGVFPAITLWRNFRPLPAAVLDARRQILDVPKLLGYRPVGTSRDRLLTSLPLNDVFRVELAEYTLRLPRLPAAWDGLTLLHLSDLHLKGTPDRNFFRVVMDRCAAWQPDLVCVTGDIADSVHHQKWVIPVLGRLRWKEAGLAILGNHDYWYDPLFIRRRLQRLRFHYLGNGWQKLTIRGEQLIVIGHEGPWHKPAPELSECPEGPFRLLLSHSPDNLGWARRHGVDLMLAGHVHGGQIRLPGIGSIFIPSAYGRRFDWGLYDASPTFLVVSKGLSGEHPLRYFCRPEVALLTLRRG
jgi:predicted MPP superfamily phosphohydrolase